MKIFTQLSKFLPILFAFCGLFAVNETAWGISKTKLTVNVSGQGQVAVTTSSTQPGSSSYSSTSASDDKSDLGIFSTHTYYVWVKPNEGYRCTGVSDCSWNNAGYYTISITGRTSQVKKEVTATFVGNSYTISFAGNSNTSGTMSDQSGFVYGTAKTLSTNTFGRAYTVTYDANGGSCGTSSATATYTFNGWKSSNGTSYADKASVSTFSPTPAHGATVTLTAQWTSASVTLPNATKDGAVLEGWYVGSIAEGNKITTATYTPTANVTLVANWINKYDFEITGDDYTINNEAWNKTSAFNFVHADEANMTTTIEKTDVISYDRAKNTITALKIGTSKITFTQNTSSTVKNGSFVFTITVDSVANTLAVSNTSFTCYVDTTNFANIISNKNSDATVTTTSTDASIAYYKVSEDKIYVPNNEAKSFSETTVTLHIKQAGTGKYKAVDKTITLTVKKRPNPLTCSWGAKPWSKNVNFDSHTAVTFTTANTEAGAPAVTVSKVSGGAVADYNSSTKKIDANHRDGTVIWEIEQVENYKYVRAFEKCTVNVGTVAAPDCDVLLYSSDPDKEASKISAITLNGLGTEMTFDIKYNGLGGKVKVKRTYNNGSSDETEYTATAFADYTGRSIGLGSNVSKVEFVKKGTDDPYINTIRVMRTKYFDIENKAGSAITEMTMPLNIHGGVVKRDTFYVDYSTCEGTIKLENHHPRIKFAATNSNSYSFSTGTAHYGRPAIALTYTSPANDAENITDTIYIYTPSDHKKLIVHAQSKGKLQTTLHYIGKASYSADTTNIASTALFEVRDENNDLVANPIITLGTGTTSNVTLANDNKSIASLCGNLNDGTTGNVTASYAGDGTYEAATNNGLSQNFTINRLKDEVSFDSGYESMVVGEEIDLTEWVTSCTSETDITVTSVFTDYIVIEDGKVKAVAKGNGRLRAASAGNCTYNSGVKFLNISVRNADDPCGSAVMYSSKLIKVGAYEHTSSNPVTYRIPDGPQDKLTFKVWKVFAATQKATLQILDKDDNVLTNGTIDYGVSSLPYEEPESPNEEINMANYPGAKKLRFYGSGSLNKYFSEVRISQKAYLTASTLSVTMSTVQACDTAKGQFTVDYSDVSHIQLSQTNNDFTYEVWDGETKLIGFENGCKDYGTYTVKFFYVPQAKGPYSNTVTISASGKSQTITLNGTANKPDRTIVWDIPSGNEISATQSVDLTAYAETSCLSPAGGVYYTAVPSDAVTIDGDLITFNRAATVTVTAHTVPSDDYNDALAVDKVWTVGKVGVVMQTLPTITSTITYGNTSSVVTWANDWTAVSSLNDKDTIPGSIAYVGPASFNAAGPQNLTFNFTPNNLNVYDATPFTVPVTVNKLATLNVPVALSFCAGESETFHGETFDTAGEYEVPAEGATRDTIYNVTVTVLQPTTGTDSKTITYGANESWNGINLSGYAAGSHSVVAVLTNAVGCDSTVTLTLTVNAPVNEFTNAAGDGDWSNPTNWTAVPTGTDPDIIVSGDLRIDDNVTVGNLTIESTGSITVITNGTLTVNGASESRTEYGDVHVLDDGALALGNSADLHVRHFTLDAKLAGKNELGANEAAASGQVENPLQLAINGKANFQMSFDPSGAISYGWYDFTVPFTVNIAGGISRINSSYDGVLTSGVDFIIMEFDEVNKSNGGKGWRKLGNGNVLQPGKLYTITFDYKADKPQNTFLFQWNKEGGLNNGVTVTPQFNNAGSVAAQRGWNGIGNGTLRHGYIPSGYKMQVYDHANNRYNLLQGNKTFAVGSAFFIQVEENPDPFNWIVANGSYPMYAPKRAIEEVDEFLLSLRNEVNETNDDVLYFSANEDATADYKIGHDLLKLGTVTDAKVAQMWAQKGKNNLCDIEVMLNGDEANTALNFFAPKAGVYELAIEERPSDADLFLTYNDQVIWDLTFSPYMLDLAQGTTSGYGLRISKRAPQITTGCESVNTESQRANRKVIIDQKMYIVTSDGAMYNVTGKHIR